MVQRKQIPSYLSEGNPKMASQHQQALAMFTHCPAQLWVKSELSIVCRCSLTAQILPSQSGLFYCGSDPGETPTLQGYICYLFTLDLRFHTAILAACSCYSHVTSA